MEDRGNKKRDVNATEEQKMVLINFMEENADLGKGKFIDSVEGKKMHNSLWDVLGQALNSTVDGPMKETVKWQRFWSDMKTRVKRKAVEIKKCRGATGGGPQNIKTLTDFEERILFFISPEAAYGVVDPEINNINIRLDSDIPLKRTKTKETEEIEEHTAALSETDISVPYTPTSECLADVSLPSSHQAGLFSPSSTKKKKVITSSDISLMLQQQTEMSTQIKNINSNLEKMHCTMQRNNIETNIFFGENCCCSGEMV